MFGFLILFGLAAGLAIALLAHPMFYSLLTGKKGGSDDHDPKKR